MDNLLLLGAAMLATGCDDHDPAGQYEIDIVKESIPEEKERIMDIQEEARKQLARDLHDSAKQRAFAALAQIARRHDLIVVSDELHAPLTYEKPHVPLARFLPERTLTLVGPGKTYNLAGLPIGAVLGPKPLVEAVKRHLPHVFPNVLAMAAWKAALKEGGPWLKATLEQLRANRDRVAAWATSKLRRATSRSRLEMVLFSYNSLDRS